MQAQGGTKGTKLLPEKHPRKSQLLLSRMSSEPLQAAGDNHSSLNALEHIAQKPR